MSSSSGSTFRAVAYVGASVVVLSAPSDATLEDEALLKLGFEQARRAGLSVKPEDLKIVDVPLNRD